MERAFCHRCARKLPGRDNRFKVASDHYQRYKEDIALFAEMGFKAYRFRLPGRASFRTGTVILIRRESNLQPFDR
ncbi:family 1 glycosylhydrolase [Bacillus licheniformis]|nr:family 1 glycosylhydrolase [Bacillus licheniformis]